ncbi:MAG: TatD family hydrolase [Candidatus Krumholzibacteriota bacterium]
MNLCDTHCHLNMPPLSDDTDGVLARAAVRGVTRVIVPAYDEATWPEVAALAARPDVFPAIGLHPWVAGEVPPGGPLVEFQKRLATQLTSVFPLAIGEIGLDTKIEECGLPEQLPVLEAQLALAADHDLPVILHCRGAFEELLTAVNKHGGKLRGVLHAYSRGPELAERFIAAGLHIAFGGAVTRDRARRVRKAATSLPLDKIVLETDAPSIGLDGVLPVDTEPGHVRDIATAVAALRGESLDTIAEVTTANACRLFHLPA